MRPGGMLICSGMIQGNTHRVEAGLVGAGFDLIRQERDGRWVTMVSVRRPVSGRAFP